MSVTSPLVAASKPWRITGSQHGKRLPRLLLAGGAKPRAGFIWTHRRDSGLPIRLRARAVRNPLGKLWQGCHPQENEGETDMHARSRGELRVLLVGFLLLASRASMAATDEADPLAGGERPAISGIGDLKADTASVAARRPAECPECVSATSSEPPRLWVWTEYLMWWTKGTYLPPLLTTSPDGTDRDVAGVLGQDGTQVVFGDSWADNRLRSGARLRFGYELGDCREYGLEGELLGVGAGDNPDYASPFSTGSPILARPLIDAITGLEDAQLIAFPELADGQLRVWTSSDLYSAAALVRQNWLAGDLARWDLLGGYRYLRYQEILNFEENLISRDPGGLIQVGTQIDVLDRFRTANDFHGGEFGLEAALERGPWKLELLARVALGYVHQVVRINGETRVTTPGDPTVVRTGGLLALPSNSGTRADDAFAALPQIGANLQWQLGEHLSLTFGYTCLVLSSVVRAGEQIDRTIDPSQLSPLLTGGGGGQGPATRPQDPFLHTTFWAQGVNLGVQVTY